MNAKSGSSINRDAFSRGKLFDNLKKFGLGNYSRIPAPQVEIALREFVKAPEVCSVTADEDAEAFLKCVKDSVITNKIEMANIGSTKDALDRLEREFFTSCRDDRITVKQFYELKSKCPDEAWLVAKYMDRFEKLHETKLKLHGTGRPSYTMEETLELFLEGHPPPENLNCLKVIADAGYGPCLAQLVVWLFRRKATKRNLFWIRGPPNTGKTDFLKRLKNIFCCVDFNFKQNYVVVSEPNKDQDPQVVLSLEFDVDQAFMPQNFNNMLTMFEGLGCQCRNNLFQPFTEQFVGERFILASNKLPASATFGSALYESQWEPILERTEWVEVVTKFRSDAPCPYDSSILAGAI